MKFNDILQESRDNNLHDVSQEAKMIADVGRLLDRMIPKINYKTATDKEYDLDTELHALASRMEGRKGASLDSVAEVLDFIQNSSNKKELLKFFKKALDAYTNDERADVSGTEPDPDGTDTGSNEFGDDDDKIIDVGDADVEPKKMQGEDLNEAEPENAEELRDKIDEISSMLEREVEWPMGDLTTDRKAKLLVRTAQQALNNLAQYADSLGEMSEGVTETSKKNFIDQLKDVVNNHAHGTIYFPDGSKTPAEPQTANFFLNSYNKAESKYQDQIRNISSAKKYNALLDWLRSQGGEGVGENLDPGDHGEYAEREMAESQLEFVKYACEEIDSYLQQFPMPEWFQNKLSGVHETMTKLHAYIEGQEGKMGLNDSIDEGKRKGVDDKECWDGYKYAGKERKADGTYKDICKPMSAKEKKKK